MFQRRPESKRPMMQNIVIVDDSLSIRKDHHWSADFIKRLIDLLTTCALVAFTLPLMMIVALAIKCDSPGPVFYRQERVGLNGRRFALLKFLSMRQDAEADGRPVLAAVTDDRITLCGGFIHCERSAARTQRFP